VHAAAGPVAVGRSPPNLSNLPFCSLEGAMQARNWEVLNVLIHVGVALWQTENGRAMLHRLLHEFRMTAPCETKLPPVEPEEGQG
jgi:hypothetical protein